MRDDEKKEGGFQVKDRRRFNTDGSTRGEGAAEAQEAPLKQPPPRDNRSNPVSSRPSGAQPSNFEINFPTFILSLASSIQISLGLIPHPATNRPELNLVSAKQTIDILGMLEEKTKGNLDAEEEHLLKQVLFELRMQFVEISKQHQKPGSKPA